MHFYDSGYMLTDGSINSLRITEKNAKSVPLPPTHLIPLLEFY